MITIKSCTDLKQSKVLSKILPLESADMFYNPRPSNEIPYMGNTNIALLQVPCWSLAALLNILPDGTDIVKDKADTENEKYMCTAGVKYDIISTFGNNPTDACYEMIIKLHELNLL